MTLHERTIRGRRHGRRRTALALLAAIATAGAGPAGALDGLPAAPGGAAQGPKAPEAERPAAQSAQDAYDERFVWFDDFAVASGVNGHVSTSILTVPYMGKYKRPLEGAAFYDAVGRPDLADRYRSRARARLGVIVAGGLALAAGSIYALTTTSPDVHSPDFRQRLDENRQRVSTGVVIGAGGILVMALGGFLVNPHPVDAPEARRLADAYNRRLREQVDPKPASPPPGSLTTEAPVERPRIALGVAPARGGAVAGVVLEF